jgi:hypothetical protein
MRLRADVDRWRPNIKIVFDITRLVREGKLSRDDRCDRRDVVAL